MTGPSVTAITRHKGIAGEYAVSATVQYAGEDASRVTFVSSVYGAPIVMVTDGNPAGVFVSGRVLDRIGSTLDASWVERFFEGTS